MDPVASLSQGLMKAALDKLIDQKDQTLEDGQRDNRLRDDLAARVAAAGLHPDSGGDGSAGAAGKAG
jgi:cation transport regulator ChaB